MSRIQTTILLILLPLWHQSYPKNAIIVGASSGMGREIAKRLSLEGYTLGLVARHDGPVTRRLFLLQSLQEELKTPLYIATIDVTKPEARQEFAHLIERMQGVDLVIISISGYRDAQNDTSFGDVDFLSQKEWKKNERYLEVDCKGFIALADVAFNYFMSQNSGHFVGISSTSGLKGKASTPVYSGAKACISTYMEAMRNLMVQDNYNVYVTDVIPGFVAVEHSPLGEDPDAYWEIPVEEAGYIIVDGIMKKKKRVYVPSKVWLVSLLKFLPDCIYERYFNWM